MWAKPSSPGLLGQAKQAVISIWLVCPARYRHGLPTVAVRRWRRGPGGHSPSPQIVASPPNLAVLLTHCDQLILRKISKFDAIRCQLIRLKCIKLDFRWGSAPDPAGGAYSAPPDPLAVFKEAYF